MPKSYEKPESKSEQAKIAMNRATAAILNKLRREIEEIEILELSDFEKKIAIGARRRLIEKFIKEPCYD